LPVLYHTRSVQQTLGRAGSRLHRRNGSRAPATDYCYENFMIDGTGLGRKFLGSQSAMAALTVISPSTFTRQPSF